MEHTKRLILRTFLGPSGPILESLSLSKEEPRLNAGEAAEEGPPPGGENADGDIMNSPTEFCRMGAREGFLAFFLSSSSTSNCGSSFRLSESCWAFQIRSISDLYTCCCSATLYRWADLGLLSASAAGNHEHNVR